MVVGGLLRVRFSWSLINGVVVFRTDVVVVIGVCWARWELASMFFPFVVIRVCAVHRFFRWWDGIDVLHVVGFGWWLGATWVILFVVFLLLWVVECCMTSWCYLRRSGRWYVRGEMDSCWFLGCGFHGMWSRGDRVSSVELIDFSDMWVDGVWGVGYRMK